MLATFRLVPPRQTAALPLLASLALLAAGCAGRAAPQTPATAPPTAPSADTPSGSTAAPQTAAGATPDAAAPAAPPKARAWTLCAQAADTSESKVELARRGLQETVCAATLWLDGLFGQDGDVESARRVSGRVELAGQHSDYGGNRFRLRFNARIRIPNLDRRYNAFLGRDDTDDFVRDRQEGYALRSPFFDLETQEKWLAGFGYSLVESDRQKLDTRVGVRLRTDSEIFAQARFRRTLYVDQQHAWRWRETAFWTNREGFGLTSSLDFDRVLTSKLLLRWGSTGTMSENTRGFDWRSAWVLYQNLPGDRAIAYETFTRGATDAEVAVREFGVRTIYRQSVFYRWLIGELVVGYSWPKFYRYEDRQGSATVGINVGMTFGNDER